MNDSHDLLTLARLALPDSKGLSIRSAAPLPASRFDLTILHTTSSTAPTPPLIVRRYLAPPVHSGQFDPDLARREHDLRRWLIDHTFPAVPALAQGTDEAGMWLAEQAVSARNWWRPIGGVDFNTVLPGLADQAVALLARLHALDVHDQALKKIDLPHLDPAMIIERTLAVTKICGDQMLASALKRLRDLFARIEPLPDVLAHGSLALADLLVDEAGKVIAWLGWQNAALADPRWDIAALSGDLRGSYQMPALADAALRGYESQSGRVLESMPHWEALLAGLRWAESAWLRTLIKKKTAPQFPALDHIAADTESRCAWAMECLNAAEGIDEDFW
jgi:hypothetical protein